MGFRSGEYLGRKKGLARTALTALPEGELDEPLAVQAIAHRQAPNVT
jgi:hypothetical protein